MLSNLTIVTDPLIQKRVSEVMLERKMSEEFVLTSAFSL